MIQLGRVFTVGSFTVYASLNPYSNLIRSESENRPNKKVERFFSFLWV